MEKKLEKDKIRIKTIYFSTPKLIACIVLIRESVISFPILKLKITRRKNRKEKKETYNDLGNDAWLAKGPKKVRQKPR